jgi:hypothetical protein
MAGVRDGDIDPEHLKHLARQRASEQLKASK